MTWETVIGLETHVELATKTQDLLLLHHRLRRRAQHPLLPGVHRYARHAARYSTRQVVQLRGQGRAGR